MFPVVIASTLLEPRLLTFVQGLVFMEGRDCNFLPLSSLDHHWPSIVLIFLVTLYIHFVYVCV